MLVQTLTCAWMHIYMKKKTRAVTHLVMNVLSIYVLQLQHWSKVTCKPTRLFRQKYVMLESGYRSFIHGTMALCDI